MLRDYKISERIVEFNEIKYKTSGVYVMEDETRPNLYKIGLIHKGELRSRVRELETGSSALPGSIKVVFFVETKYPKLLEQKMHQDPNLIESRYCKSREWFSMDMQTIYKELKNHALGLSDCLYIVEERSKKFGISAQPQESGNLLPVQDGIYESQSFGQFEYKENRYSSLKHKELQNLPLYKFCIELRKLDYKISQRFQLFWYANNSLRYQQIKIY